MGSIVMMYVLPMLLGQTYDLGKEKPGIQIFPKLEDKDTLTVQHYFTDAQYRLVEDSQEVRDFLSVDGRMALKIKAGLVDADVEGSYLKDASTKSNALEILVKVHFETVTRTLPSSVSPLPTWSHMDRDSVGSHFCRSITYGGSLVASIRFSASSDYDLWRIKGAIAGGVHTKGGSFSGNIKAKLDMLKQSAQDSSSMEINYYSSVPIEGISYDIDGLIQLIDAFPDHVKKVNNGVGRPIRMELYPITSLRDDWPIYTENRAITNQLDDLEFQFDDLRETRRRIGLWLASLPPITTEAVYDKIQSFMDKNNEIYDVFLKTISELDVSKGASTQPLAEAFSAYKDGDYYLPHKYIKQLKALQKKTYEDYPELQPRVGGALYTRWGSSNCSTPDAEVASVGVMATSEVLQDGGSDEFLCHPLDPVEVDAEGYFGKLRDSEDPEDNLLISPVRYTGNSNRHSAMSMQQVACVQCRSGTRTSVLVQVADTNCPSPDWTREYEGHLMAPGPESNRGQFVCVDDVMVRPVAEVRFGNEDESRLPDVQEVVVECGSLPCKPYVAGQQVPCAVCTM